MRVEFPQFCRAWLGLRPVLHGRDPGRRASTREPPRSVIEAYPTTRARAARLVISSFMRVRPAVCLLLLLACGCASYPVRKFLVPTVAATFESWRIYVDVEADMYLEGKKTPENHRYKISCTGWTACGDYVTGLESFRKTAYRARFDTLKITYLEGDKVTALPLDDLTSSGDSNYARLEQGKLVAIPPSTRDLVATVTMTFTAIETGKTQTKVFEFKMKKYDGKGFAFPDA